MTDQDDPSLFRQELEARMIRDLRAADPQVRRAALQPPGLGLFLHKLQRTIVDPVIIEVLRDEDLQVRCRAAELLGRFGRRARSAVSDLLRLLNDPDVTARWCAAKALASIDRKVLAAIPVLVELLESGDDLQWISAANALGRIGPPAEAAIPGLLRRLSGFSGDTAAHALRQIGPKAVAPLLQVLSHPDASIRQQAARVLGDFGPEAAEAAPALRELLKDPVSGLRQEAAVALANLGQETGAVIPILVEAVRKQDLSSWRAVEALARIGPEAVPALLEAVGKWSGEARVEAIRALRQIGPPAVPALPLLRRLVEKRRSLWAAVRDWIQARLESYPGAQEFQREELRVNALMALIAIGKGRPEVAPVLVEALTDPHPFLRRHAAGGLGKFGAAVPGIAGPLLRALHDPDDRVRMLAAESLATFGEALDAAVPVLVEALQDRHDGDRRSEAAAYLAVCGPAALEALPHIVEALHDIDARVRLHAAEAVWRIGRQASPAVDVLVKLVEGEGGFTTQFLDDGIGCFNCVESLSVSDSDPVIQAAAARILGDIGPPAKAAAPALTAALEEANPVGRDAAAALQKINSEAEKRGYAK
jgi:HEAT repeat protein